MDNKFVVLFCVICIYSHIQKFLLTGYTPTNFYLSHALHIQRQFLHNMQIHIYIYIYYMCGSLSSFRPTEAKCHMSLCLSSRSMRYDNSADATLREAWMKLMYVVYIFLQFYVLSSTQGHHRMNHIFTVIPYQIKTQVTSCLTVLHTTQ